MIPQQSTKKNMPVYVNTLTYFDKICIYKNTNEKKIGKMLL